MRIFRKSHMWKDNRTFIELDAQKPKIERGYPVEGHVFLKIGKESSIKGAFKLSVDEARGLRDSIDMFLRFHDMKLSELRSEESKSYDRNPLEEDEVKEEESTPFFMFNSDDDELEKKENKEEDNQSEFYF